MLIYSSVPVPLRDLPWVRRPLYRGAPLYREGDRAELIFLLDSGLVKLSRQVDSHRKTIVRLIRPGELVGDRALGGVSSHRYTAEPLSECAVWEVSREAFRTFCDQTPAALAWVTQQVEQRLAEVERRVELITFARVETRILSLLLDLAEASLVGSAHHADSIQIPLSQSEIAQLTGATRETASTTLNQMQRRGLLRLARRQIEILSLEAVRAAASGDERASGAHS